MFMDHYNIPVVRIRRKQTLRVQSHLPTQDILLAREICFLGLGYFREFLDM